MAFSGVEELIVMGGHGIYVWSAYFLTWLVILFLVVSPLIKSRKFFRDYQQTSQPDSLRGQRSAPKHTLSD